MSQRDCELQDQVQHALRFEAGAEAAVVGVSVQEGVVTLSGSFDSVSELQAIEEAVLHVPEALDVVNDLHVLPVERPMPDDAETARAVRSALVTCLGAPHTGVKASVSHGVVTLHGSVESWQEAASAEEAVGAVAGVQDVFEVLDVHEPVIDAATLRAEVRAAIEARRALPVSDLDVMFKDGEATVGGAIYSVAERKLIVDILRRTPGVKSVNDLTHLTGFGGSWS
jgi:osmotically-inducible protein OsmY